MTIVTAPDEELVERVVAFHGHDCPGTSIGIQAARLALAEVGPKAEDEEMVAVVETDLCPVDAIQALTGCTIGKGNMIHRDWGKNAYTFYDPAQGRAVRIAPNAGGWNRDPELESLMGQARSGPLDAGDAARLDVLKHEWEQQLLAAAPESLFTVEELADSRPPAGLREHPAVRCQGCDEDVAESQIHRLAGRSLCGPCLDKALVAYA